MTPSHLVTVSWCRWLAGICVSINAQENNEFQIINLPVVSYIFLLLYTNSCSWIHSLIRLFTHLFMYWPSTLPGKEWCAGCTGWTKQAQSWLHGYFTNWRFMNEQDSQLYLCANYLITLNLNFFLCKRGLIISSKESMPLNCGAG